jgi:phospholipid/cholesterol/gamma-HCH transport system substrate-binding protein
MAALNEGKGSLGKLATQDGLYNRFDSLVSAANQTLAKINGGGGTAGQVLNNTSLYQKVDSTLIVLNELIVDIKQHPKKYVKISLF